VSVSVTPSRGPGTPAAPAKIFNRRKTMNILYIVGVVVVIVVAAGFLGLRV
jgi:hypothetical protein